MIERTSALVDIVKKTQAAHRENVFTFGGTELLVAVTKNVNIFLLVC